jgi:hypothetical protein
MTAPVQAKKPGDWTCVDFLKGSDDEKSRIVYWFEGVNHADKKDVLDIAAKDFNVPVKRLSSIVQEPWRQPVGRDRSSFLLESHASPAPARPRNKAGLWRGR